MSLLALLLACPAAAEKDSPSADSSPVDTGDSADTADSAPPPDGDDDGWADGEDCAPGDPAISPGAVETCNGVDDNCDGEVDEGLLATLYTDADGDAHGDAAAPVDACPGAAGTSELPDDCDDAEPLAYPGNTETCGDGIDNDCDGTGNGCRYDGNYDLDATGPWIDAAADGDFAACAEDSIAGLGDVDGDGIDDFAVGATGAGARDDVQDVGGVHVVLGSASGLPSDLSGAWAFLSGAQENSATGEDVAGLGDVDGDGLGDLVVVGARENTPVGEGVLYTCLGLGPGNDLVTTACQGRLEGTAAFPWAPLSIAPRTGDLTGDGTMDLVLTLWGDDGDGAVVACDPLASGTLDYDACTWLLPPDAVEAGDVLARDDLDGDGVADLVNAMPYDCGASIGCTDYNGATGAMRVYSGPVAEATPWSAWTTQLLGEAEGALYGSTVATCDTNGDGYFDLVTGAPEWAEPEAGLPGGAVYWHEGPLAPGSTTSYVARVVGSSDSIFVGYAMACAGDSDGDGRADVAFSSRAYPADDRATLHLVYGPGASSAAGDAGPRFESTRENGLGVVASLGDIDADSLADVGFGHRVGVTYDVLTPDGGLFVLPGFGL